MELISGYKLTNVGVIPNNWQVKTIGEITDCTAGGTPSTKISSYWDGSIPWMSSGELNLKYVYDVFGRITEEGLASSSTKLIPKNCVLIGLAGQGKTRGTVAINLIPLCTNQSIAAIFPSESFIPTYLYFNLDSRYQELRNLSLGGGGRGGLNLKVIKSIQVPLPSLDEQRSIAQILTDIDMLLVALNKIIAKKRDIKQAVMQNLLTGKMRLPGFSGDWAIKALGEISICLDYLRVPLNETQRGKILGDYPYCGANGILGYVDDFVVDDDIILMAEDGGYFDQYETRPIAYRMTGKCWVNNHAHILKAKSGVDQGFLFYSLSHKNILPFLASATRAKLNKSEMNKIQIKLPTDELEQIAISTILTDIDSELNTLKARHNKIHDLKQAMMQELLTGKTRLIYNEQGNA